MHFGALFFSVLEFQLCPGWSSRSVASSIPSPLSLFPMMRCCYLCGVGDELVWSCLSNVGMVYYRRFWFRVADLGFDFLDVPVLLFLLHVNYVVAALSQSCRLSRCFFVSDMSTPQLLLSNPTCRLSGFISCIFRELFLLPRRYYRRHTTSEAIGSSSRWSRAPIWLL